LVLSDTISQKIEIAAASKQRDEQERRRRQHQQEEEGEKRKVLNDEVSRKDETTTAAVIEGDLPTRTHDGGAAANATTKTAAAAVPAKTQNVQSRRRRPQKFDFKRTFDVAVTGFVWSAPISHCWFALLERIVTVENKVVGLALRILLDATFFSPFVGT